MTLHPTILSFSTLLNMAYCASIFKQYKSDVVVDAADSGEL
jgi:hypothetical protein